MSKSMKIPHSIIAAAKDDTEFQAVGVCRHGEAMEVLWTKSMPSDGQNWSDFASACGMETHLDGHARAAAKHPPAVVGLDATAVAFYKISAPKVGTEETAAIVRMQAESLLPLPSEQIEVAWRTSPSRNGKADITIAAARRDYLHKYARSVRDFGPRNILLACEGTAKAWQALFSEQEQRAVVVSVGMRHTQVCLVLDGHVANAIVLDTGMHDFAPVGVGHETSQGPTALTERFAQDLWTVLEAFGWTETAGWPVLVLSDGSDAFDRIIASLNAAGIAAKASVPRDDAVKLPAGADRRDIYTYRVPLGLALITLDGRATALDLFDRLTEAEEEETAKSAWNSATLAGIIAAVMLIVVIAVSYAVDVASEKRLSALVAQAGFEEVRQHQTLLKTVARYRPDLLGLLTEISDGQNDGIVLDSLNFRKGQAVTLMGQAGNEDQMWKYQQHLLDQAGIADVEIGNSARDSKTKKIKFTMTFQYKAFTKKGAAL